MSTALSDLGLGRLVEAGSTAEVEYQPFEVSRASLGIIAKAGHSIGKTLQLESIHGCVDLEIADRSNRGVPAERERYHLLARDYDQVDLEGIFTASGCYDRISHLKAVGDQSTAAQFRNSRFDKGPNLTVVAQTFGTSYRYHFKSQDISRSGMLIVCERECLVPFNSSTLLELVIDPQGEWLKAPLACIAKVIRRSSTIDQKTGSSRSCFGIHFVELSEESQKTWRSIVEIADNVQTKVALLAA